MMAPISDNDRAPRPLYPRKDAPVMTLVTVWLPGVSILATCRSIHLEARDTLAAKLTTILAQTPKLMMSAIDIAYSLSWSILNPLSALTLYHMALTKRPGLSYPEFLQSESAFRSLGPARSMLAIPDVVAFVDMSTRQLAQQARSLLEPNLHGLCVIDIALKCGSDVSWNICASAVGRLWLRNSNLLLRIRPDALADGEVDTTSPDMTTTEEGHLLQYGQVIWGAMIPQAEWEREWEEAEL